MFVQMLTSLTAFVCTIIILMFLVLPKERGKQLLGQVIELLKQINQNNKKDH